MHHHHSMGRQAARKTGAVYGGFVGLCLYVFVMLWVLPFKLIVALVILGAKVAESAVVIARHLREQRPAPRDAPRDPRARQSNHAAELAARRAQWAREDAELAAARRRQEANVGRPVSQAAYSNRR